MEFVKLETAKDLIKYNNEILTHKVPKLKKKNPAYMKLSNTNVK